MNRLNIVLAIAIALALAGPVFLPAGTASASPAEHEHEPAPRVVRIGFAGPLSGASEELGKSLANAAELAVIEANRQPLRIKGQRVQLRLLRMDDRNKEDGAVDAAGKLIKEGVIGVIGGINSNTARAALPVYSDAGVAMVTPSASLPSLAATGSTSFFRMVVTDSEATRTVADYVINNLHLRRVAVIDNGSMFGTDLAQTFELLSRQFGATVVSRASSVDFTTDMHPLVRQAKDRGAQAIFFGGYSGEGARLALAIQHNGGGLRLAMAQSSAVGPSFLDMARTSAEHAITAESGLPTSIMPGWPRFQEHYQRRFGSAVYGLTPFAYDGVQALVAAMRRADSDKPTEVRDALRKLNLHGLTGTISFDERGNRRYTTHTLFEVRQQRWVPLKVYDEGRFSDLARRRVPPPAGDGVSSGLRMAQRRESLPASVPGAVPD